MTEPLHLIVIGASARALAASARRAGFIPLAIDVFGDQDTIALCAATIRLDGGLACGLARERVVEAVGSLVERFDPAALVYGSGFEDQPEVIETIAALLPVAGNRAEVVARAKDPNVLGVLCEEAGLAYPETVERELETTEGWLIKKRGGAGGGHVASAAAGRAFDAGHYYQRRVAGEPRSALFLADGERAEILGFSAQWAAPTLAQPFRFGGACGPIELHGAAAAKAAHAVASLTRRLGLIGLNSADFLVDDGETWLLEVNPRPGVTLDIFDSERAPLMAAHLAACQGRLTPVAARDGYSAVEIVYASVDLRARASFEWPDWAADRPAPGASVARDDPFCSVGAEGRTFAEARALAGKRSREMSALAAETEA
jgi:uncharacterized protein